MSCDSAQCLRLQGIVKALFENGLLPKVLSGSSVGSISALFHLQYPSSFTYPTIPSVLTRISCFEAEGEGDLHFSDILLQWRVDQW